MSKEKKAYSIADALKKVNKAYDSDLDKLKLADDQPDDYFLTKLYSTGSIYLDYKLGGVVKGALNLIVGKESAGKSSVALCFARQVQLQGKMVVIFDAEASVTQSYLDRFGIEKKYLVHVRTRNLEEVLDLAQEFSQTDDVGMIIFDSIPIFTATAVEEKSANDGHMGIEAKKWTTRFAIIEANCIKRDIAIVGLTFYTYNMQSIGDPRVIKRGEWQRLAARMFLELSKKTIIFNEDQRPVGHVLQVRTKKSKVQAFDPKDTFLIDFYYEGGFDNDSDAVKILLEEGVIEQTGAWYKFSDVNSEEVKIQGETKLVKHLVEDVDTFQMLKDTVGI